MMISYTNKNEYNELIQKIKDLEYWNKIDKRIENIKVGNAHFMNFQKQMMNK